MIENEMTIRNKSKDSVDSEKFWLVDYPLFCYKSSQSKLIMAHLADPAADQIAFAMDENEQFIAFVDRFSAETDCKISYLAFSHSD